MGGDGDGPWSSGRAPKGPLPPVQPSAVCRVGAGPDTCMRRRSACECLYHFAALCGVECVAGRARRGCGRTLLTRGRAWVRGHGDVALPTGQHMPVGASPSVNVRVARCQSQSAPCRPCRAICSANQAVACAAPCPAIAALRAFMLQLHVVREEADGHVECTAACCIGNARHLPQPSALRSAVTPPQPSAGHAPMCACGCTRTLWRHVLIWVAAEAGNSLQRPPPDTAMHLPSPSQRPRPRPTSARPA